MKRVAVIALVFILIFFAALAALVIYLDPRQLDPNRYRPEIKAWIEERLNAEVELGYISPVVYPGLGLECRDFSLKIKPEGSAKTEDFFSVRSVKVLVDLSVLVKERRLLWEELIFDSPSIYLRRGPDKELSVKNLVKPRPEKPAEEPPPANRWVALLRESIRSLLPDPEHRFEAIFDLQRFEVHNASLKVVDQVKVKPAIKAPVDLKKIDFTLHGLSATDPGRFSLNLPFPQAMDDDSPNGPPLALSGKIELDEETRQVKLRGVSGTYGATRFEDAAFTFGLDDGRLRLSSDVALTLASEMLHPVLNWPPIHRSNVTDTLYLQGQVKANVHLDGPNKKRPFKMNISGTAEFENGTVDPGHVTCAISGFQGVAVMKDGRIEVPEMNLNADGILAKVSGHIEEAYAPLFYIVAESEDVDFAKLFPSRPSKYAADDRMMPMRSRWEGDAKIGKGYYGAMVARDIEGHWSVDEVRRLRFHQLRGRAYKGEFEDLGSWVDFNDPREIKFYFAAHLRDMEAKSFIQGIMDAETFVDAPFSAKGYITGRIVGGEMDMPSVNGEMIIHVKQGELEGQNLVVKVLDFLGVPIKPENYAQPFRTMKARVVIRDGIAYFDDLVLRDWNLEAHAAGYLDFVKEEVNLRIALYPLEAVSTLTKPLPLIGALINQTQEALFGTYAKLTGDWSVPEVSSYLPLREPPPEMPAPRDPEIMREILRRSPGAPEDAPHAPENLQPQPGATTP